MNMSPMPLFFIVFLWGTSYGACPCTGEYVCSYTECKKPSNGVATCTTVEDCADPAKASCTTGVCTCNSPRKWSVYHNACLYPNDDTAGPNTIFDCMDRDNGEFGTSLGCTCSKGNWNSALKRCGLAVGSSCIGINPACADEVHGRCNLVGARKCVCNDGYGWDSSNGICRPINDGTMECDATSRCYDRSERALCDGYCKCQTGAKYRTVQRECGWLNTGAYSCASISECYDQTTGIGACEDGKCTCAAGCVWNPSTEYCEAPNDNTKPCTNFKSCMDQSNRAECSGNCKCKSDYVWASTHKKCLFANNDEHLCSDIDDCADQDENRAECSTTCKCLPHFGWDSDELICKPYNDDYTSCSDLTECYDQTENKAACNGNCKCESSYLWDNTRKKCVGLNDGISTCGIKDDCFDNSGNGKCDGSHHCTCKSHFLWRGSPHNRCLGKNDGFAYCDLIQECVEQSTTVAQCNNNACECKDDYLWSETREKCCAKNRGGVGCSILDDCADNDSTKAICESDVCKCLDDYAWGGTKCLARNNDEITCSNLNECLDHSSLGLCSDKCTCVTGSRWDDAKKFCLYPNDGTHNCHNDITNCVDQSTIHAKCGTNCECEASHEWSADAEKCLAYNNGDITCTNIYDCLDQTSGAALCTTHCTCETTHLWVSSANKCLAKNTNTVPCDGIEDCVDQDTNKAECVTNCKCKSTHSWSDTTCLANNDEQTGCTTGAECFINNSYGTCINGKCACITGSKWDPAEPPRCLRPNDGTHLCNGGITDCSDQRSGAGLCDTHCKCAAKHVWDPGSKKCLGYNDGTTSCVSKEDCVDRGDTTGECKDNLCSCKEHHTWSVDKCMIDNDSSTTCATTSECYDHGDLGTCSTTCKCVAGSDWDTTWKRCKYPNDGTHDCTGVGEGLIACMDQRTDAAICDGECKCKSSYHWSTVAAKCLGDNDGSTICTTVNDCLDHSGKAICDNNCKCKAHHTWVTDECLIDNDDTTPCNNDGECVDQSSVGTCSTNCKCIAGSTWSDTYKRCLLPNDNNYPCTGIAECVDSRGDAAECDEKCKCKSSYEWSEGSEKCLGYNDGSTICTTVDDCLHHDLSAATCSSGHCGCNTHRVWVYDKCLAKNNEMVLCSNDEECFDQSSLGECAGTCKCIEGGLWKDDEKRCLAPNDGNHDCEGQLSNCADQRTQAATCDTNCDCNPSYEWRSSSKKCLGYNDDNTFCSIKDDCWDSSDKGVCDTGACKCAAGYMWSDFHKKCLIPNDMSLNCAGIEDCIDQDTLKAVCSTKCDCVAGYTWVVDKKECLLENDETNACNSITLCADQDGTRALCDTVCKCQPSYKWSSADKICLGYNDGVAQCDSIDKCMDQTAPQAECNGKCVCNSPYRWIEGDKYKCLAPNDGTVECSGDITLCIDQDPSKAACNTYCVCNAGHLWNEDQNKCLIHNDENTDCAELADCVEQDPVAGLCDGKCKCTALYSWYPDRKRCLAPNDGTATCTSVENCLDGRSDFADCSVASNNKCDCKSPYIWIESSSLCLGPNDGTATCADITDCIDQTALKTECSGAGTKTCKCTSPYLWHSTKLLCLAPNDETCGCTVLGECYDQTATSAECSLSSGCACKTNNQWSPGDKKCVCVPGTNSPSGYGGCTDCPEGHYQDQPGQTSCKKCSANEYNPSVRSTSASACQGCPSNSGSSAGSKYCTCDTGYYSEIVNDIQSCPKCHSFCEECSGTATTCSLCKNLPGIYKQNNQCLCNVDDGFYVHYNANTDEYECRECHRLCKQCYGDTDNECSLCRDYLPHVLPLSISSCKCELGYFYNYDENDPTEYCSQCGLFCTKCSDLPDNCSECVDIPGVMLIDDRCKCAAPGYFQFFNTQTNTEECIRCHALCLSCDGPSADQCSSCDSSKGAVFVPSSTCKCEVHFYYDATLDKCLECNELCQECIGPSSNECQGCNSAIGFSIEGQANMCVYSCGALEGYFAQSRVCKQCHPICKSCTGPQSTNCLLCSNPSKVMFEGACYDSCPTHYYASSGICYSCHDTCFNCTDGSSSGCISCQEGLYLWKRSCVQFCPEGSFVSGIICEPCQPPCETCISTKECVTCVEGAYKLLNSTECVEASDCPPRTYPDLLTRTCQNCYYTCLTCNGPANRDCILCNFAKGFGRGVGEVGECYMLVCKEGEYLKIDYDAQKATCEPCHEFCKGCSGDGEGDCIECPKGRQEVKKEEGVSTVWCKTCSEINPGYYTDPNGKCKGNQEICGDGLNLGQVECDDGNRQNGDGCDSNCRVELGYKCFRRTNLPDHCIDVTAPQASLSIKQSNVLVIGFSERVFSIVDSMRFGDELAKSLEITMEGNKEPCKIEWHLEKNFTSLEIFEELVILSTVSCHLKGGVEKFVVKFKCLEYVKDFGNNSLSNEVVYATSLRQLYISEEEKAAISGAGTTFSSSSLMTFGLVLGMNLFQSAAVGSFWAFINMLQVVSYVPAISCVIPYNLEILLTEYLTVSKVVFPFTMLPSFIPNPLSWVTDFLTNPFNDRFSLCGYESLSFIYNFSEQLFTWLILGIIYIILNILTSIFPKEKYLFSIIINRCAFLHRWKKDYEYNAVIRVLIECYLNLVFTAALNIWAYLAFYFLIISFQLVETPDDQVISESFKESYGTITEDLKQDFICRCYYPIYLVRRLIYALILIILTDYPIVQIISIIGFLIVPMMSYLIILKPFEKTLNNILNIYNELVVAAVYIGLLVINTWPMSTPRIEKVGWGLVIMVLGSLVSTWIILLPGAFKEVFEAIINCFSGEEAAESKTEKNLKEESKMADENLKQKTEVIKKVKRLKESPKNATARISKVGLANIKKGQLTKTKQDVVHIRVYDCE